ncbi:hypothetical protein D6C91_03233 [Aureobasidium pullulans]|uniref:NACHT domain-containing protein n=1 Tax=Aureobasidium pullulans TaxID=5580 RepID=A0A4S9TK17_AURPU|nr:hypothetical protein D6C91_03233 [Aureobasidium pullulans]
MGNEKLTHDDYTVAWICPLEIEQIAALEMLDEEHPKLPQLANDHNVYTLGSVQGHNVVVAGLPTTGNCSAATVVAQMRNTFPHLRFGLLVGIGGGVPTKTDAGPIRLGHIVVSKPVGQHSGAVQYDHGKAEAGEFVRTGFLAPPPTVLLNAASALQVHRRRVSDDPLIAHLNRINVSKRGLRAYKRPSSDQDQLYEPDYIHLDKGKSCKKCGCEASKRVNRDVENSDDESACEEDDDWLVVHRGTIASGEAVMRNGSQRDALAGIDKILCFEMEAAGALNDFPCMIVRGISDYSDSHKNDKWHGYAAAVAAAYARELFRHMPVEQVKQCKIVEADIQEMVETSRQGAKHSIDSRIRNWLRPADASVNYNTASGLCHPGTGAWFLKSPVYKKFLQAPHGRLWLRGIPGSGKTVLASTIVKELRCADEGPESAIIYFFFSFSDDSKQRLEHLVRSLIFQLSGLHKAGRARLTSHFEKHNDGYEQPPTESLVELLDQMICDFRSVTIVLDALDESNGTQSILQWITSRNRCKFLLTGRPERDIEEALTQWLPSNCAITLENEPMDDDIKAYVHHKLETEKNLSRWKSIHNLISDTLVEKAGGMFRWVYCQLEELSGCLDKPAVRLMLQTLPLDLNHTYDRILQNIPRSRVPNAIKLLQFLAFSNRPMSLRELVDAIATDPNSSILFDVEDRLAPPDAIIGYCSSLVRLIGQAVKYKQARSASASALPCASSIGLASASDARSELHLEAGSDAETETEYRYEPQLELAHFSVKEYLLLHRNATPYQECFQTPAANAMIASTCLAYLWTLQKPHLSKLMDATHETGRREIQTKFPLTDFATRHWLDHARVASENQEKLFFWTSKIFVDKPFMTFWLRFYNPALQWAQEELPRYDEDPAPPLYHASLGGLDRSVRLLLERGAAIDAGSRSGASALQIAAHEGNVELVEILIGCGANVNARNRRFRATASGSYVTALQAASNNGHVRTVQILLDHGSDINAGSHEIYFRSGTALRTASANGHLKVVQLLLDHGADVNIDDHGFALHAALSNAHTEVSLLLLERGADILACNDDYRTALAAAVYGGDLAIVKLLLERGAHNTRWGLKHAVEGAVSGDRFDLLETLLLHYSERDRKNGVLNDALKCASPNSDGRIIRILLETGADEIHYKNDFLSEACHQGSAATVELLLDFGAKFDRHFDCLNEKQNRRLIPSLVASQGDQLEIAKLLVARDAKSNSSDLYNATALKYACAIGRHEIVEYLLENDADFRKPCDYLNLPLEIACRNGTLEVINMLLKYGAKVDACDSGALTAACEVGHIGIAQLLLAQGADVNGRRKSKTPIQAACSGGHLELVELLRDRGADVNARGGKLGTALCSAASINNAEMAWMLLERGADPNLGDKRFGSALQAACSRWHWHENSDLVQLLLDNGADVNVRGGIYGNALCAAVYNRHVESVHMLLGRGARIDMRGGKYGNALQIAIEKGLRDIRKSLLKGGWKIVIHKRPFWRRRCALSDWHPSIQRERLLHPLENDWSSSVLSDYSWSSASSGTTRTSSLDRRHYGHEPYLRGISSIRSSSDSPGMDLEWFHHL